MNASLAVLHVLMLCAHRNQRLQPNLLPQKNRIAARLSLCARTRRTLRQALPVRWSPATHAAVIDETTTPRSSVLGL